MLSSSAHFIYSHSLLKKILQKDTSESGMRLQMFLSICHSRNLLQINRILNKELVSIALSCTTLILIRCGFGISHSMQLFSSHMNLEGKMMCAMVEMVEDAFTPSLSSFPSTEVRWTWKVHKYTRAVIIYCSV